MSLDAPSAVLAGVSLGALSAAHCTLMCGPVAMLARARKDGALPYFAGRISSYVALGALAGGLGSVLLASAWASAIERSFTLLLVVSLLWAAVRAWKESKGKAADELLVLGRAPKRARLTRVLALLADEPLLLGAATALLPCATLFAAVSAAAASGSALAGALLMAGFGVVTGAAVVGLGGVLSRLLVGPRRVLIAAVFALAALLTLLRPGASAGGAPSCPLHAEGAQ